MDSNSRLGGCGIRVINGNFIKSSKLQTEDQRTQKTELILSPIHQIKLRLGGYSIWSASTSRDIYTDSGLEHLIASMQSKKHSEDYYRWTPKMDDLLQKHSKHSITQRKV